MKPEMIVQVTTLTFLLITVTLQIRNFVKYNDKDSSNTTRVVMILATTFFIVHTIRLILDYAQGYFFACGVFCLLFLFSRDWFAKNKV